MDKLLRAAIIAIAGLFALGMVSVAPASAAGSDDRLAKREDSIAQVATVDDDADGDDDTNTGNTGNTNNDGTGVSNDGTNSRHTAVSRDRDRSRGDLTKDWTRDGGDRTRDYSRNYTNDQSRNDTR